MARKEKEDDFADEQAEANIKSFAASNPPYQSVLNGHDMAKGVMSRLARLSQAFRMVGNDKVADELETMSDQLYHAAMFIREGVAAWTNQDNVRTAESSGNLMRMAAVAIGGKAALIEVEKVLPIRPIEFPFQPNQDG